MRRTVLTAALVGVLTATGACQRKTVPSVSPDQSEFGRFEAALAAGRPSTAVAALLDRLTSATQLHVPKPSLKALAEKRSLLQRRRMVELQIEGGIRDGRAPVRDHRVIQAMRLVPRHEFVPRSIRPNAYIDSPLPIGYGQTISQPYIVALMTELLQPKPGDRVLEIGTGSGYQAAVLGVLVKEVYTIEIVEPLGKRAEKTLKRLGYDNVHVRIGDGYRGWPKKAPFDGVIVTAAPERIPPPLVEQMKVGGRMVIPVGPVEGYQQLLVVRKTPTGVERKYITGVRFVPMVGEALEEK